MRINLKIDPRKLLNVLSYLIYFLVLVVLNGCAGQSPIYAKMSGNLDKLSEDLLIAILPVQTSISNQKEAAELFRQSLYADFTSSRYKLMERYIVDSLLEQHEIRYQEDLKDINAIRLGEILGADAILTPIISKVERSYAVIHSSIELTASIILSDARTGEILWTANQTETDYEGITKIPTGIFAAAIAPFEHVTNKVNLEKIIQKLTKKLTSLIRKPEFSQQGEIVQATQIASNSAKEIETITTSPEETIQLQLPRKKINIKEQPENPIIEAAKSFFYTIQVGAYKSKIYAQGMIEMLVKKGYFAYITPFNQDKQIIYKVNVERFENKEQAGKFAQQFSIHENLDHFITRVDTPNPS
jgi:hypothetical protein